MTMLALSVKQPWADLLVLGKKTIEMRTWRPPSARIDSLIAIHTGKEAASGVSPDLWRLADRSPGEGERRLGGIVGAAQLLDLFQFDEETWRTTTLCHLNPVEWWDGSVPQFGWEFGAPVRFETIIPCRGRLGLYPLPVEIEEQVQRAMIPRRNDR